jgi:hypothetical protein
VLVLLLHPLVLLLLCLSVLLTQKHQHSCSALGLLPAKQLLMPPLSPILMIQQLLLVLLVLLLLVLLAILLLLVLLVQPSPRLAYT